MRQINRLKSNLITYVMGPHKKNETQGEVRQLYKMAYMPSERRRRSRVGTSKGRKAIHMEMEK